MELVLSNPLTILFVNDIVLPFAPLAIFSVMLPPTKQMVTGYSKTTPGQQMLKVTYTSDDDKKYEGYFKVMSYY